jgi:glycosyltransferase involved in cell wall biosynthesis
LDSHKVHALGHGIDTARFSPQAGQQDNPPLVLAVGRIAPIKHHHILLEAAALLRDQYELPPVRFAVAGTTGVESDEEYLESLKKRRCKLGMIEEDFAFLGPKQTDEMIELYRRASVVTNLSPIGLFDKAALEAMATETPVIVSNPAFDNLLGKHVDLLRVERPDDAEGVAERLAGLLSLSVAERAKIGQELRARTIVEHGLDRLMTRITELVQEGS